MQLQEIISEIDIPQLWWTSIGVSGIIRADGNEVFDLIHRLSTNACTNIQDGMGKQTILTNEKGRIIDIITLIHRNGHALILTSNNNEQQVISWLKKYIIMESITFTIVTQDIEMIAVHGPQSLDFISQFIGSDFLTLPIHCSIQDPLHDTRFAIRSVPLHELQYTIIDFKGNGLLDFFSHQQEIPQLDQYEWNRERILAGQGMYPNEWSEAYNPLEAGLLHLIDFKKGCYIGQEVIARLDSYNKVNKRLMGISSQYAISENDAVFIDDAQIGIITSICKLQDATIGLGYIRSEYSYDDTKVRIHHEGKLFDATLHIVPMRK